MPRRHELTDEQYELIAPLLPSNGHRGGQWNDHRPLLNGMLLRLHTGVAWPDLPERYGPWQTVYDRFNLWCRPRKRRHAARHRRGLGGRTRPRRPDRLGPVVHRPRNLQLDPCDFRGWAGPGGGGGKVFKKRPDEPEDHALGRSRGGFGTKLHLIVDGRGVPLAVDLSPGQTHDSKRCEPLIERTLDEHPDVLPMQLAGDKGYSDERIRQFLEEQNIDAVIPRRRDQRTPGDEEGFDRETYRRRSVVEYCIGWLKECRDVATRYDKLATNFLGTVQLAIIGRYLRKLGSSDTA